MRLEQARRSAIADDRAGYAVGLQAVQRLGDEGFDEAGIAFERRVELTEIDMNVINPTAA